MVVCSFSLNAAILNSVLHLDVVDVSLNLPVEKSTNVSRQRGNFRDRRSIRHETYKRLVDGTYLCVVCVCSLPSVYKNDFKQMFRDLFGWRLLRLPLFLGPLPALEPIYVSHTAERSAFFASRQCVLSVRLWVVCSVSLTAAIFELCFAPWCCGCILEFASLKINHSQIAGNKVTSETDKQVDQAQSM